MAQFTAAQVAEKFDTTPREVRKFLRSVADPDTFPAPGRGGKWMIEGKALNSLRPKFRAYIAARDADADSTDA